MAIKLLQHYRRGLTHSDLLFLPYFVTFICLVFYVLNREPVLLEIAAIASTLLVQISLYSHVKKMRHSFFVLPIKPKAIIHSFFIGTAAALLVFTLFWTFIYTIHLLGYNEFAFTSIWSFLLHTLAFAMLATNCVHLLQVSNLKFEGILFVVFLFGMIYGLPKLQEIYIHDGYFFLAMLILTGINMRVCLSIFQKRLQEV